jgi:hypothetical protein
MIIEAARDGWTPELFINKRSRTNTLTASETEMPRFLARCCLVSKEWCRISQPLLYRGLIHGEQTSGAPEKNTRSYTRSET